MYFHLVCSPEFFGKVFRRSRQLMVLKYHEFGRNPTVPPYAFNQGPLTWAKWPNP